MREQLEVIADLEAAGVLDGVRWAYRSAVASTLDTYSEQAGHDAALLGMLRHTLLRDRLDRVFGCEKYTVAPDAATEGLDELLAELTSQDIATMPQLGPGIVRRADLNGSPGWAHEGRRLLLASCVFGKLDELPWKEKSPTKQLVADQPNPEPPLTLFDDLPPDEIGDLASTVDSGTYLDLDTFVVAHTLDVDSQRCELVLGRSRLNHAGGTAWHWKDDLLTVPPTGGSRMAVPAPRPDGPSQEPDAAVYLRRPADAPAHDRSGDET